jgi:hypothetical protein
MILDFATRANVAASPETPGADSRRNQDGASAATTTEAKAQSPNPAGKGYDTRSRVIQQPFHLRRMAGRNRVPAAVIANPVENRTYRGAACPRQPTACGQDARVPGQTV